MGLNQIQVESQVDKAVMPDNLKVGLVIAGQPKRCASGGHAKKINGLGLINPLLILS